MQSWLIDERQSKICSGHSPIYEITRSKLINDSI